MPKGLFWVNSGLTSSKITASTLTTWYESEHIPDILKTSGMKTAHRYESLDQSTSHPYLALYPVADVNFLGSKEFYSIPTKSDLFPGPEHRCFDFVDFDTRCYEWIDEFGKEGVKAGPGNLIISAALEPAKGTDDDFDSWYKEEHYRTLSACPGYVRTTRYKLWRGMDAAVGGKEGKQRVPTYLSLHEFQGDSLPQEELKRTGETEWAKRMMGGMLNTEVLVFRHLNGFGDVNAKF